MWATLAVLFLFYKVQSSYCDCTFELKDLPKNQPIYIQDGNFWMPHQETGKLVVKTSGLLVIGCPGKTNQLLLGKDTAPENTVEAQCLRGKTFAVGNWRGTLESIKCKAGPTIDSQRTSTSCSGGNYIYRVGFTIADEFYKLYELCFNVNGASTLYSHHTLYPSSVYRQSSGRPAFIENGMFETTAIADLYKAKNQVSRLDKILGEGMGDRYIKKKQFLTKGHLSPRGDFSLYGLQRATFLYANVAPQWAKPNEGDWASLEDSIRTHIKQYGKEIEVYTGTKAVESLPDSDGRQTEIYLTEDENNNGIVPVPLYYYKVIYDPLHKKAAAFVEINSSFFNDQVTKNLTFCDDICQSDTKMSWVKWRDNDGTTSFCCDFNQFKQTVNHFDLDVKGLFY